MTYYYKPYSEINSLHFPESTGSSKGPDIWWETYFVLLYYCYLIDVQMADKLKQATYKKILCMYDYNEPIPEGGENSSEADYVYLPLSELPTVISFSQNEVVPALENEPDQNENLVNRWGGGENFWDYLVNTVGGMFEDMDPESHDEMDDDPRLLLITVNQLIEFFQYALSNNWQYYQFRN